MGLGSKTLGGAPRLAQFHDDGVLKQPQDGSPRGAAISVCPQPRSKQICNERSHAKWQNINLRSVLLMLLCKSLSVVGRTVVAELPLRRPSEPESYGLIIQ